MDVVSAADGEELWDEEKVGRLLAEDGPTLFVSGTVRNQGRFYDRFDAVVLFSAPTEVILERISGTHDERVGGRNAPRRGGGS